MSIPVKNNNGINVLNCLKEFINPLTSTGEGDTVFTSPYLSAGAPEQGEAKGLNNICISYITAQYLFI